MNLMLSIFNRSLTLVALAALSIAMIPNASVGQQEQPPAPSQPRSVQFPKPVEKTLKNGLRVVVIERPGSSLVSARLLLNHGTGVGPPGPAGVADMIRTLR